MRVAVVACRNDDRRSASGRDDVAFIDELCTTPSGLAQTEPADRLVLILHAGAYVESRLQRQTRELGMDPLLTQIVLWEDVDDVDERLGVMAAGAAARAMALGDASPHQMKPVLPDRLNRRALFNLPTPVYTAVPVIDTALCAASDGCHACVDECPEAAYTWESGRIVFDKQACVSCGRCVTTCPTEAIENPTISGRSVLANLQALIEASSQPIGVVFTCSRRQVPVTNPGWYPVEVPCASMVPGTWPVAALLAGAAAATIMPCSAAGCSLRHDRVVERAVDFARALLLEAGVPTDRIPTSELGTLPGDSRHVARLEDPFGRHGPVEVALALSEVANGRMQAIDHPAAPIGIVEINTETCTLCGKCASVCPTEALTFTADGALVSLGFDAAACTACHQCVMHCPEISRAAIQVRPGVDLAALQAGAVQLNTADSGVCELCGGPVAPAPMLERIASMLGDEHRVTMAYLERRCMSCRGV